METLECPNGVCVVDTFYGKTACPVCGEPGDIPECNECGAELNTPQNHNPGCKFGVPNPFTATLEELDNFIENASAEIRMLTNSPELKRFRELTQRRREAEALRNALNESRLGRKSGE